MPAYGRLPLLFTPSVMFANASDRYLDTLLPENRMYGFAVSQALNAVLPGTDCAGINNQPQSTTYEESKPQAIDLFWDSKELPDVPDFYGWSLKVVIDPSKDFHKQSCWLTRSTETYRDDDEVWVCSQAYVMTLRALLHVLRQPKGDWETMLGCFERDYDEGGDYVFPTSELVKR